VAIGLLSASRCEFYNHMHLDRTNNASKNNYENANTHVHDDVHLVMLAHLRRRWSLSGREGFGFLSPSRRACEAGLSTFWEMKRHFSTTPEVRKETEANGGHQGDRTLNWTPS
jgi:hypothetical protein